MLRDDVGIGISINGATNNWEKSISSPFYRTVIGTHLMQSLYTVPPAVLVVSHPPPSSSVPLVPPF